MHDDDFILCPSDDTSNSEDDEIALPSLALKHGISGTTARIGAYDDNSRCGVAGLPGLVFKHAHSIGKYPKTHDMFAQVTSRLSKLHF